jgi:MFS transporter, putative metabolite:H+ symporter
MAAPSTARIESPGARSAASRLDLLPITSFHRRLVWLLGYIFFFELGDLNSFGFAAPALRESWQLSIATIGRITSASFVGMFLGATTAGWLSDRLGRKRALIATTTWYSVWSLANAFAWDVTSLAAARLLTGVGLSAMTVVAITYISEMFPAARRGTYQAWIMTIGLCGIPATAYVARFIIPAAPWGWRAVFVWGSLALLFPVFARTIEESPRWYERRGRTVDAERVLARIERSVEQDLARMPVETARELRARAAADAASTTRPVADGSSHALGLSGFSALAATGSLNRLALLVAIWIAQTLGFYGFNSWVPTLLTEHGFSIVRSLEQASVMQIGAVPGAWIAATISDRWERRSLIAIVALAVGTCGMIYGLSFRTSTIVIFGFLVAMGQQVFAPLLYAYTPECFPTEARNTGTGASYGIGRLGNALGPLIVASLFSSYGYTSVFVYIALCWAVVAVLVTGFGPRTKGRTLA